MVLFEQLFLLCKEFLGKGITIAIPDNNDT